MFGPFDKETPEEEVISKLEADKNYFESELVNFHHVIVSEVSESVNVGLNGMMDKLDVSPIFRDNGKLKEILAKHLPILTAPLDEEGMKVPPMQIYLKEGSETFVSPYRYVSNTDRLKLKEDLEKLVKIGILREVHDATYSSPLVLIRKKDGSLRIAVDYRRLNELILPYAGTIPNMRELFAFLAGKKYYAKLDNVAGFHQLKVDENSRKYTVISTPFGLYEWTRVPFGIKTAPGTYQQRMDNFVLKGLLGTAAICYIDDTLVVGETEDEFLKNLDLVLSALKNFNVRLKVEKCSIGYESIQFLGHLFNSEGYQLTEERKQGIRDLSAPKSLTQLRSFLGLVNFTREFIPNLSEVLVPITELTKGDKGKRFIWTAEADIAFNKVKELICDATTLHHLKDEGKIYLTCDASDVGCGGMLSQIQRNADGVEKEVVISYNSHKFSTTAANWTTTEKEAYAVVYSVNHLRRYLIGREFTVRTDHFNLKYLRNSNVPKLQRWRLILEEFDFSIEHIPGKENVVADSLSRLLANAIVVVEDRVMEIEDVLRSIHNNIVGHHGRDRTIKMLKELGIYSPSVKGEVIAFLAKCPICQKVKTQPVPVIAKDLRFLHGSSPMRKLAADSIGPLPEDADGNKYILVIIDEFSKYVTLFPTKNVTAVEYAMSLVKHVAIFGVMEKVKTDRGTQFTAKVCEQLARLLCYDHDYILPYYPQANGIVERRNAEVMKHLRALSLEERAQSMWSTYLPVVQLILNSAHDFSIGRSPCSLIFGDVFRSPLHGLFNLNTAVFEGGDFGGFMKTLIDQRNGFVEASHAFLRERDERLRRKDWMAELNNQVKFKVGDYVFLIYNSRPPTKLSPLLRGPYKIVAVRRDDIIQVEDLMTFSRFEVHISKLRLFKCDEDILPEEILAIRAMDEDEYVVDSIVDHSGTDILTYKFRIRWLGYGEEDDTWLSYESVKDLEALDKYEEEIGIVFTPENSNGYKLGKK